MKRIKLLKYVVKILSPRKALIFHCRSDENKKYRSAGYCRLLVVKIKTTSLDIFLRKNILQIVVLIDDASRHLKMFLNI